MDTVHVVHKPCAPPPRRLGEFANGTRFDEPAPKEPGGAPEGRMNPESGTPDAELQGARSQAIVLALVVACPEPAEGSS